MKLITLDNYRDEIRNYIREFSLVGIDYNSFIQEIASGLVDDIEDHELVKYLCEVAASYISLNHSYSNLACIILAKYLHYSTPSSFSYKIKKIQKKKGIFSNEIMEIIDQYNEEIDGFIDYSKDFEFTYFGIYSLLRSYCVKLNNKYFESPQDVYMRVALQLYKNNMEKVKETYILLSDQYYTHATPTMYNACFVKSQLASCVLISMKEDTIDGIFKTINEIANFSKAAAGIGLAMSNIRSNNSKLVSSGGVSNGIVPVIKLINDTCKYINQGGARRVSAISIYLEPWHQDIFSFLDLKKNFGDDDKRARDVFPALWVPDLFMERVMKDEHWSLFDPNQAKGLQDVHGEEFNKLYLFYEKTKSKKTIRAQDLWKVIITSQIETGTPYLLFKDKANHYSNQSNLGTIKSSNLCSEIIEYTSSNETACCILASVCLPKCVKVDSDGNNYFDFDILSEIVKVMTDNLNIVVDEMYYVTEPEQKSNLTNRPLGIGIQGLADVFMMLRYPFESEKAKILNREIAEVMYYAALKESCELSKIYGPYSSFKGSNLSKGILQFELHEGETILSSKLDWEGLRSDIKQYGTRNSLLIALMPTAGTSQICGNFECFEPITANIITKQTLAGDFQFVNKYLMNDLIEIGMWNDEMRMLIIDNNGSIQNIPGIPSDIKELHKTVWEMSMKSIIDMAADRQRFVDQSQSLNLSVKQPTHGKLTSMHFYSWRKGLVTAMYYLRTQTEISSIKFTIDKEKVTKSLNSLSYSEKLNSENNNNVFVPPSCDGCSG